MEDTIIVKNLYKSFKIFLEKPTTLKEKVLFLRKNTYREVPIVKDVSFTIRKGEMVGLIGQNGSGKSTLLKLLTKIIYPEKGSINIQGRVSSLLELGAGFHPDFSGVENIFMNASIFGLSKKEIESKVDDIIKFSELEEFIYNPVRTYSSGMYMRLAFATAINVEPDILLVDEVLAVGDASFQRKCLNRIKELKRNGKTIVLVTHDHGVVERLCDRAIWLESGRIREDGSPKTVVNKYLQFLAEADELREEKEHSQIRIEVDTVGNERLIDDETKAKEISPNRWGTKDIEITDVRVINRTNSSLVHADEPIKIELDYVKNSEFEGFPVFGIAVHTTDKLRVYGTNTEIDDIDTTNIPLQGTVQFIVDNLNLIEGDYEIDVAVHDESGKMFDYLSEAKALRVVSLKRDVGISRIPHEWNIISR